MPLRLSLHEEDLYVISVINEDRVGIVSKVSRFLLPRDFRFGYEKDHGMMEQKILEERHDGK
jgi:hypothetical protein